MRKSRFTDSQIMDALRRVEAGIGVPDLCRDMGISTATFYKWRAKYGGMDVSMMSRMKELEEENRRLKKMYLEEKLKAEIVSEALEKMYGPPRFDKPLSPMNVAACVNVSGLSRVGCCYTQGHDENRALCP